MVQGSKQYADVLYKTLTAWDVELFSYKPDIFRTLLQIAVNAMAQSNINKTRFLLLPAPSNQIMQSKSGWFHSPRLP